MSTANKKVKTANADVKLSVEELKKMRDDVKERITVARIGLLLRHPFFGNLATRLIVKDADDWLPTAATDGKHLWFNTQFFNSLSNREIEFVIAHEILHCVYDHLIRREHRHPMLYNIAADYKVNNLLVKERIGERPKKIDIFQDMKYDSWTSEEIYEDLLKKGEQAAQKLGQLLDEHIDWEGDSDSDNDNNGESNENGRPKYTKQELEEMRDEFKEAMISAAQSAGNTPGEIERLIKELTEPKMNWREIIRQQIQSTIRDDYTFSRPSRKNWHTGAVLPGMNFATKIDVCISLDMSGSIGDAQARDFLSEIKGIMEEFKDYTIKIWCFDTKVYNEEEFTSDNGKDLMEYNIMGGGGTDFMINWTYMRDNDIEPKMFIMFTDMCCYGEWGIPEYCETIFINHGGPKVEAPFGITVDYSEASK